MMTRRLVATVGTVILAATAAESRAAMDVTIGGVSLTPAASASWSTPDAANPLLHVLNNPVTWSTADGLSSFKVDSGLTQWDPDPSLVFSASATNDTGSAQTYTFTFSAPLTPNLLGTVASHAQLGVTLTDGGDGVVNLSPAGSLFMLTSYDLDANGAHVSKNVDLVNAPITAEGLSAYAKDSSLICNASCTTMYATLSFTLSAGDSVGFSGKITQTAVPLPAAGLLFGSGLLGLVGIGRRRKLAA